MTAAGTAGGGHRQLATFVLTGGIAALANLIARWLFSHAMTYAAAVALAYLIGMTVAFLLARAFVFTDHRAHWHHEYARFALVNVVSLLVVLGVSLGMLDIVLPAIGWPWHAAEIAHLAGVASPILLSFYAHKHFSFGRG